jgi:hypothetical protein
LKRLLGSSWWNLKYQDGQVLLAAKNDQTSPNLALFIYILCTAQPPGVPHLCNGRPWDVTMYAIGALSSQIEHASQFLAPTPPSDEHISFSKKNLVSKHFRSTVPILVPSSVFVSFNPNYFYSYNPIYTFRTRNTTSLFVTLGRGETTNPNEKSPDFATPSPWSNIPSSNHTLM